MPQYDDVYMRDYPGDKGQIPSSARVSVSQSPDIIPAGRTPVQGYETHFRDNYNGPYNYFKNIYQGEYNYIYVRGKNLFHTAQTGKISLYYAPSSLLLLPSIWINNKIPNVNNTESADISAAAVNDLAVGRGPFYWSPAVLGPKQGHYCLIARVVTAQHPNIIPSDDNLRDFAAWVRNKPGIAWRNVHVVKATPTPSYQNFVGITNPDPAPNLTTITATCTNIPDNTTIRIAGALSGPKPLINKTETVGPDNQIPGPQKTNLISLVTTLPAKFEERLEVTATLPPGISPPPQASIVFSYYLNVPQDEEIAAIGIHPEEFGLSHKDIGFEQGGRMLLLGDYTIEFDVTR